MKRQIQKLTVRSPRTVQIAFFALLILPILVFLSIKQVSASPLDSYCERQFQQSMRYKISPLAYKKCQSRFDIKTNEWMT